LSILTLVFSVSPNLLVLLGSFLHPYGWLEAFGYNGSHNRMLPTPSANSARHPSMDLG
jgi:hypothetical protein